MGVLHHLGRSFNFGGFFLLLLFFIGGENELVGTGSEQTPEKRLNGWCEGRSNLRINGAL